ncbi:Ger(x)C family spore germination C-terminal domain-containing protein [Peribacillus aracenensis]|uniref:Ger(x)C family spore germination C-terminal domain-containing protein n=1 Tax=Peribacillus aracenensis TaxID=2976708 RepID=UPI0021A2E5DC|nr:Ger(x)C family spore germination C-terminal domain-containing protein [Peribacillus sp. BBB004]
MINNSKLVGVMNDEDIAALNWLNGEVKGGIIEAVQHGKPLSVEVINRTRKKIKTELNGDQLTINIRCVENQHPKFWEKNKKKWDEIFGNAVIHHEVDIRVVDVVSKGGIK